MTESAFITSRKQPPTILALHNAVRCPQGFQGRFLRLGFLFALLCFLFALLSDLRAFGFVLPQGAPVTRVNLTRPFESRFFIEWSASNSPLPTYAIHRNGSGTHSINTTGCLRKSDEFGADRPIEKPVDGNQEERTRLRIKKGLPSRSSGRPARRSVPRQWRSLRIWLRAS